MTDSLLDQYTAAELAEMVGLAEGDEQHQLDLALLGELRALETEAVTEGDRDSIDGWRLWLPAMFPMHCRAAFATHHEDLWRWVWQLEHDVHPKAMIAIWNRGGAKSTSAELGVVSVGCRARRRYVLYVCETQDQADDHVSNIGALLESATVERHYPDMATRAVGKYGNAKGWRRNRLRTAAGFTVDALGLDTAVRGVKIEDQRPDMVVLDDIDNENDTPKTTRRKVRTLTTAVMPAGAPDLAVLGAQNLVHAHSIFAQLADGRADFLQRRIVSGPVPALDGARFVNRDGRQIIDAGTPTWEGLPVARCQEMLDDMGLTAFKRECLHEVAFAEATLWNLAQLETGRRPYPTGVHVPRLATEQAARTDEIVRAAVGVDPSGGSEERNDEQGIVVCGLGTDGHGYVLADRSCRQAPEAWGKRAVRAALDFDAEVVCEVNFGGDMVISVVRTAAKALGVAGVVKDNAGKQLSAWTGDGAGHITLIRITASRGKRQRAEPVAALYGDPADPSSWPTARMHHVEGVPLEDLEAEMSTWNPDSGESPNRMDALVWAATRLMVDTGKRRGGMRFRGDE